MAFAVWYLELSQTVTPLRMSTNSLLMCSLIFETFRDAVIFNMDPANEDLPYPATADISVLVNVNEVAEKHALGPNGGLLFAMEYLEEHFNWLEQRLAENQNKYVLFDFPGQVELYTHNNCIRNIVQRLEKIGYRVSTWTLALFSASRVLD